MRQLVPNGTTLTVRAPACQVLPRNDRADAMRENLKRHERARTTLRDSAPDLNPMIDTKLWQNPCWLSFRANFIAHHFNQPLYDWIQRRYRLTRARARRALCARAEAGDHRRRHRGLLLAPEEHAEPRGQQPAAQEAGAAQAGSVGPPPPLALSHALGPQDLRGHRPAPGGARAGDGRRADARRAAASSTACSPRSS